MEERFGLTAEMYKAIVAVVDDRIGSIRVPYEDFDRLVDALARTEAALNRLAEAQARTGEEFRRYREASEERSSRMEAVLNRLAEAQARTEEEFRRYREASEERSALMEAALNRLTEAQARTEASVGRLAEVLERLSSILERLDSQMADLRGWLLELRYLQRAPAYFGTVLRKARVVSMGEIEEELEAKLSEREFLDLLQLDLLVCGEARRRSDLPPVWLAVEVSGVIDIWDIARARRYASILRQAGYIAIPTVAGVRATNWVKEQAFEKKVLLVEDGHPFFWEEALSNALAT